MSENCRESASIRDNGDDDDDANVPIVFAKYKRSTQAKDVVVESAATLASTPTDGKITYAYIDLLERAHAQIAIANPDFAIKKRFKLPPPQVAFEGSKKTIWSNFDEICKLLHRSPEHVMSFLWAETGTDGALDGARHLVIKGRYKPKQIESILRHYLSAYVRGGTCAARSHRVRRFAPCANPFPPLPPRERLANSPSRCVACARTRAPFNPTIHLASYVIGCSSSPDNRGRCMGRRGDKGGGKRKCTSSGNDLWGAQRKSCQREIE
jgi:translation initiation factor 2 beta subunit (eIF-2beta)/eIF-5